MTLFRGTSGIDAFPRVGRYCPFFPLCSLGIRSNRSGGGPPAARKAALQAASPAAASARRERGGVMAALLRRGHSYLYFTTHGSPVRSWNDFSLPWSSFSTAACFGLSSRFFTSSG